jgi:hypothetical protein
MKVKCATCGVMGLTENKEYKVVSEENDGYIVINDWGKLINYYKWVFKEKN